MAEGTEGQQPQARPKINVQLAHGAKPVTVEGDINIGAHGVVTLPDEATQRAGFLLDEESLALLLIQFPMVYKRVAPKARPAVPVPPADTTQGKEAQT